MLINYYCPRYIVEDADICSRKLLTPRSIKDVFAYGNIECKRLIYDLDIKEVLEAYVAD